MAKNEMPVVWSGMTENQKKEVETRIAEFERDIEPGLVQGKGGYVDLISDRDYIIAGVVNVLITIYYFATILS